MPTGWLGKLARKASLCLLRRRKTCLPLIKILTPVSTGSTRERFGSWSRREEEQERSAVGLAVGWYWSCRSFARPGATLLAPYSLPVFCLFILLIYSALFQFFSRHRKPANNNGKWLDIVPLAAVNSRSPILL